MSGPVLTGQTVDLELANSLDDGTRRIVTGLSRQNSVYRHMIDVCDQIAEATLTGTNARQLAQMLARLIKKTVVLLDARFGLRAHAGYTTTAAMYHEWQLDDPGIDRLLRALAAERRPLRMPAVPDSVLSHGCLAIPIGIGATELGYLLILDGVDGADTASDDTDLLIAGYVATLFALTLANERTSIDLGLRYHGAVVDALVSGQFTDADDARRKIEALGISDESGYQVGVIRSTSDLSAGRLPPKNADELCSALLRALPDAGVAVRHSELVMIVPSTSDGDEDGATLHHLQQVVEKCSGAKPDGVRLICGISDGATRPDDVPRLFREAQNAVEIGCRITRFGPVVSYSELGIYRLLLQVGDERQLSLFAEETLGPLIRYDATHKLELVHTLSVFLNQRESLKQAARRLHVHANTVTYRLQRIEQLTPLNLSNPDDRLLAHVAVKILELRPVNVGD